MSSSLKSIVIPDGVTLIDIQAFSSCEDLTSVTIPGSVKRIGEFAFEYCRSLASVTLCEGVERIERSAFSYCLDLSSLNMPESLSYIGTYAFSNSSVSSITFKNTTGWKVNGDAIDVTSPTQNANTMTALYSSQFEWIRE